MSSASCFLPIMEKHTEVAILIAYILLPRSASLELINFCLDINQFTVECDIELTSNNPRALIIIGSLEFVFAIQLSRCLITHHSPCASATRMRSDTGG